MKLGSSKLIALLGLLTAVIYNSWPLGYVLNPQVAKIGLVSDLEASGQPYNWLFIACDIICGLLTLAIVSLLLKRKQVFSRQVVYCLAAFVIFGVMTALSASLPLRCSMDLKTCGYQSSNQIFGLHDLTGAIASFGLFVSMFIVCKITKQLKQYRWNVVFLVVWSIWGAIFLLTPLSAINQLSNVKQLAVIWQQIFLVLSGINIYLLTDGVEKVTLNYP